MHAGIYIQAYVHMCIHTSIYTFFMFAFAFLITFWLRFDSVLNLIEINLFSFHLAQSLTLLCLELSILLYCWRFHIPPSKQ